MAGGVGLQPGDQLAAEVGEGGERAGIEIHPDGVDGAATQAEVFDVLALSSARETAPKW